MSKIQSAVDWAVGIASDSTHGYDQTSRWGPDYDCSSLVISAYEQAGVPVKSCGATYTGNMRAVFAQCGFSDVSASVNKTTGAGLLPGDVLLHERNHTALYIGGGKIVHASGNERGGITGGQTGDQTGGEICVRGYYNYPWDCVLRYEENPSNADEGAEPERVIRSGDTLWGLAERWLGSGWRYKELMEYNGLTTDMLSLGQIIRNPAYQGAPAENGSTEEEGNGFPRLKQGDVGLSVKALQTLLKLRGCSLPQHGVDGDFGAETEAAVRQFQTAAGLSVTGAADVSLWRALVS